MALRHCGLRSASLLTRSLTLAALPLRVEFSVADAPTLSAVTAFANDGDDRSGRRGGDDRDRHEVRTEKSHAHGKRGDRTKFLKNRRARNGATGGGGLRVVKFERNANEVEVVYSNGVKEEIEFGRYERKNAFGRAVEQRAATAADFRCLRANVRNFGIRMHARREVAIRPAAGMLPAGSRSRKVEVSRNKIEVRYIGRCATTADRARLLAAASH